MKRNLLKKLLKTCVLTILTTSTFYISKAQTWSSLAANGVITTNTTTFTSIVTIQESSSTVPYLAWVEGGALQAKKYVGTTWSSVGGVIAANASDPILFKDKNSKIYIAYIDIANSSRMAVKTFNTSTSSWESLDGTGSAANLYVSSGSATYSISQYNSAPRCRLAFTSNNTIYAAFLDGTSSRLPVVKKYNSTSATWETVGTFTADIGNSLDIAFDANDKLYATYISNALTSSSNGALKVFTFNTGTSLWSDISPVSPVSPGSATTGATTAVRNVRLVIDDNNNPMVFFTNTGNSNKTTILYNDVSNNTWVYSGTVGTRDANYVYPINDPSSKNIYVFFTDALTNGGTNGLGRVYVLSPPNTFGTATSYSSIELIENNPGLSFTNTGGTSTATFANIGLDLKTTRLSLDLSTTGVPYISYYITDNTPVTPLVKKWTPITPTTLIYASYVTASAGTSGASVAPTSDVGTAALIYTLEGTVPSGVTINSTSGIINYSSTSPAGTYALSVKATNSTGNITTTYTLTLNSALPITLTNFTAKADLNTVKVAWTTSSEIDNDKFIVEKSTDGQTFSKLAEVKAKGASNYLIVDNNPSNGTNYYRLVQVDLNGDSKVFGPVAANFSLKSEATLVAFPNPTLGNISFSAIGSTGNFQVSLSNITGNIVHKENVLNTGASSYSLNLNQKLAPGKYILQVKGSGFDKTTIVIVL